ncbi:ankyrin repeat and zinc finger domain-containing protein 1 [Trichosurus vulpecula]|uniref:ankyrin repeat and zinc finger domain-containing protein 1 n=1 Tax=Trichosurus vulpecula TaxID=9337 RepID=UPI00186B0B77|nr:ankyrin repeat and zinc finger domain-containing protein 1 [Trichosurus vulpecula]
MPPGPVRASPPASVSVFDLGAGDPLLQGLRLVGRAQGEALARAPAGPESEKAASPREQDVPGGHVPKGHSEVSDRMFCSACIQSFQSRQDQREHYTLDWHRFNLKQRLKGQPPLSAPEFEKQSSSGDFSSISGSEDSDSDWDTEKAELEGLDPLNEEVVRLGRADSHLPRLAHRVLFCNAQGQFLSAFRCLLGPRQDPTEEAEFLLQTLQGGGPQCCVVLMAAAGHFAGAVFRGREVVTHKTFHRYTVRARRGTAQGLQDARVGGSRSAGANLRRYNEAALYKEVRELLAGPGWAGPLGEAGTILLRAPRSGRALFFGGHGAPLHRGDPRVWDIPLATRRPTFRELQRVLQVLAMVHIHGEDPREMTRLDSPQADWKVKSEKKKMTSQEKDPSDDEVLGPSGSEGEGSSPVELELVELTLGTLDLCEFELLPKRRRRKRKKKSQEAGAGVEMALHSPQETVPLSQTIQENMVPLQPSQEEARTTGQQELWDALWAACRAGNVGKLKHQLEALPSDTTVLSLVSAPLGSGGSTLLHAAAAAGRGLVVQLLLENGADPTVRDSCARPPYAVAADKMTRNEFRKFMEKNPDAHDYSKAQVPGPLTAEMEANRAARRREQKASRRLREEQRRQQQEQEKREQEEQQRFAALSDREKRALAAEYRLAAQLGTPAPPIPSLSNTRRCWGCGASLQGLVPFHYLDFSFCSTRCLQEHRQGGRPLS